MSLSPKSAVVVLPVLLILSGCSRRPDGPITSIAALTRLPVEPGARYQVHLTGWVTIHDRRANLLFIEDENGAARVDAVVARCDCKRGDRVDVRGVAKTGGAAPIVGSAEVESIPGTHAVSPAPATLEAAAAGRTGFHLIEIEAVIRSAFLDTTGGLVIHLASGGQVLAARPNYAEVSLQQILPDRGARVRVRGVANPNRDVYGSVREVQLRIGAPEDIAIVNPSASTEAIRLNSIAELFARTEELRDERVLLRGKVIYDGTAGMVLHDETGTVNLVLAPSAITRTGSGLEVIGYLTIVAGVRQLADASVSDPSERDSVAPKRILSSTREVHNLRPQDAAAGFPVRFRATVTYVDNSDYLLFVQDQAGGIFVFSPKLPSYNLSAGDVVMVSGETAPGDFAPIVGNAVFEHLGRGPTPQPVRRSLDDLLTGIEDSNWIEVEGVVQGTENSAGQNTVVKLSWGEHAFYGVIHDPDRRLALKPDTKISMRGACATIFNAKRQILGIRVYVPGQEFLRTIDPPFDVATLNPRTIDELLQFSTTSKPGRRVRVRGVVTDTRVGGPTYISDSSGAMPIRNHRDVTLKPGELVDAIGFAHAGRYGPEMRDAEIFKISDGPAPAPARVTVDEALESGREAQLLEIDAVLVEKLGAGDTRVLALQAGGRLFHATMAPGVEPPPLERGSILRVAGICSLEAEESVGFVVPKSLTLRIRDARDIRVVRSAPWWTGGRLLTVLFWMAILTVGVLCWVALLRRRVRMQTDVIRKKLDQEAALKESAEQANRAKSEFLANMSHEIRTPMNGILGFTEILGNTPLSAPQRECVDAVSSSAQSLLVIVNDILDFSRIEAGRLELQKSTFGLRECVHTVLRLLKPMAAGKGLALGADIAEDAPDSLVGDPHRLRQILLNLVGNAVKFTSTGSVSVKVTIASDAPPPAVCLQFAISDTGIGIARSQQEMVFQPFRQADGSVTRRFGGTGLGLSICRKLVEVMHGRIWLESEEGRGSTFFFTAVFEPGVTQESRSIEVGRPEPVEALSILVAEDNATNRLLLQRLLEARGHRVRLVENGSEALQFWRRGDSDLILMDIHMPEMDGFEATRRIRAEEVSLGGRIPIIALTANAMPEDRERCLSAGMDAYLSKPFRSKDLDKTLREWGPTAVTS